jgi:hypothetical protein
MSPDGATINENHVAFLRYVPHGQLISFLARGWAIADELHGTSHGEHAVLMTYQGDGEPI